MHFGIIRIEQKPKSEQKWRSKCMKIIHPMPSERRGGTDLNEWSADLRIHTRMGHGGCPSRRGFLLPGFLKSPKNCNIRKIDYFFQKMCFFILKDLTISTVFGCLK